MGRRFDGVRAALASSFGLGYAPFAPGTFGTLPAVALYVAIALAAPAARHGAFLGGALALVCLLAVPLAGWAERHWGRKDPQRFVLDEVAGFLLTVTFFRVDSVVATAVWAFCVTRVFDVVKPPPVRQLEKLPGGWGVLLDDLCASVYAVLVLHLAAHLWPAAFGVRA
ncbi:MAG: phosphatidylglycerophosphatase A [Candidatus Brocadiaceae bacterium]|nr:phosphatidylglycerophosphatase A [Candidatus Brocadiaceae bacterium]